MLGTEIVATVGYGHGRVGAGASHWHFTIIVNATRTQLLAISCLGREKAEGEISLLLLVNFQCHVSDASWPNPLEGSQRGGRGQRSAEVIRLVGAEQSPDGEIHVGEGTK